MRIITADQMREVDRLTTERFAIAGLLLMENAAVRTACAIAERFGPVGDLYVKIVCGRGNNGGDGAAIARQLWLGGAMADVILIGHVSDATGDARTNFEIVRALSETATGIGLREIETSEDLWDAYSDGEADVFVDAMFGTGLSRPVDGLFAEAIELLNAHDGTPVVSVDLPSGLASDLAESIGPHVHADLTVTFTALKPACALPPAVFSCGEVVVADIGSPAELVESCGSRLSLVAPSGVEGYLDLSKRRIDAHKGTVGSVLVIGGSVGKTGAPAMAAEAVLKSGAGLATIATARSAEPVLASRALAEAMTEPVAETDAGVVSVAALERLRELAASRTVVAIGPGLGLGESQRDVVRAFMRDRERPVVVDADALTALSDWPDEIRGTTELPIIVTPHPAEMARIASLDTRAVVVDRVGVAREFATRHRVFVVLKGARTIIAEPGGEVLVNPTGNSGMATGGSGDVLTGVIAGLLAQRPSDPLGAAVTGVYLHGLAGDLAVAETGIRALVATDISEHLGRAFLQAGGTAERV